MICLPFVYRSLIIMFNPFWPSTMECAESADGRTSTGALPANDVTTEW
jgi:hypothetical protein